LAKVAERINDPDVMHLLKLILKTTGAKGVPQGGGDHAPNAKGNFQFERMIAGWRSQRVLDLRRKR
jgi:hypothetical protein